jgi:hypothetical protein
VSVAVPGSLILLGLATARGVSAALGDSASAETRRLLSRARLWAPCHAVALLAQVALAEWGIFAPARMAAFSYLHASALIWASYLQADALLPEGVSVPLGPLRRTTEAVCHAIAAGCCGGSRSGSVGHIIAATLPMADDAASITAAPTELGSVYKN